MFARLFSGSAEKKNGYSLYQALVKQARQPSFYTEMGVEDSIEGRLEMILLHLALLDERLGKAGERYVRLRRFIQEAMVSDMDLSLRELGVGDMSVGKEMKKVGAALLGRKAAYNAAMAADDPQRAFGEAITKNIFAELPDKDAAPLVAYVKNVRNFLAEQDVQTPAQCEITYPDL